MVVKWDAWTGANYSMTAFFADPSTLNVVDVGVGGRSGEKPVANLCAINNSIAPLTVAVGIFDGIPGDVTNVGVFPKPRVDLVVETEDAAVTLQHTTPDGSIMEPATSSSALAVGATCIRDNSLEFYSSRGPTIDGRIKPDLVAADATSSNISGLASGCTGGFTGTSASAPHVAGAAALAMQELRSDNAAQVRQFLATNAFDLGTPGLTIRMAPANSACLSVCASHHSFSTERRMGLNDASPIAATH